MKEFWMGRLLFYIVPFFLIACTFLVSEKQPSVAQSGDEYTMVMSSYLGGGQYDTARDIEVDDSGNIYVTGGTASTNFPTTAGAYSRSHSGGGMDVFVTKFDPDGNLVWSTYIGGPNYDRAYAIEVDSQGNVYVAGRAGAGYPTTAGVLQPIFGGDNDQNQLYGAQDGFVTKLSPNGSQLVWSTYFGGNDRSFIRDIDIDSGGQVHLALTDVSTPNPHITPGAFQSSLSGGYDGVVAKLSSAGSQALWATYFGGSGQYDLGTPTLRVDPLGNVYVLGGTFSTDIPTTAGAYDRTLDGTNDMHLAKFSSDGDLLFGTFLGGSKSEWTETHGLWLDAQGNAFVAGTTTSGDFPTTSGVFQPDYGGSGSGNSGGNTNYSGDGFISKISSNGTQLMASTYLGGRHGDGIEGVGVDALGNVYVSGATYSDNFPVTANAYQGSKSGDADFLAAKLSADLSQLQYGTYLGGSNTDYGRTAYIDSSGNFYVAGEVASNNWPTQDAYQPNYGGNGDTGWAMFSVSELPTPTNTPIPTITPTPTGTPSPNTDTEFIHLPLVLYVNDSNLSRNCALMRSLTMVEEEN